MNNLNCFNETFISHISAYMEAFVGLLNRKKVDYNPNKLFEENTKLAYSFLYKHNKNFLRIASSLNVLEDAKQILLFSLWKVCSEETYRSVYMNNRASFSSVAYNRMKSDLSAFLAKESRYSKANVLLSDNNEDNPENLSLDRFVNHTDDTTYNDVASLIDNEELFKFLKSELTEKQYQMLEAFVNGNNFAEISRKFDVAYNTVKRFFTSQRSPVKKLLLRRLAAC